MKNQNIIKLFQENYLTGLLRSEDLFKEIKEELKKYMDVAYNFSTGSDPRLKIDLDDYSKDFFEK